MVFRYKDNSIMNTEQKIRERFPVNRTPQSVQETLLQLEGKRAVIACSAGADSTFLVYWLCSHFCVKGNPFTLVHFDHKTRGVANCEDASFVENLARRTGCDFSLVERLEMETGLSEDSLRQSRFKGIMETMQQKSAKYLFLGHNREDVTETMWMRLSRGSGPEGLAAPRPVSIHQVESWPHVRIRPLLYFSGLSLRQFLEEEGITWREDSTNHDESYARNYLRQKVLPVWDAYCDRNVHLGAARSRDLLEECSNAIACWAKELYPKDWHSNELDLAPLENKPKGLIRFVLLRWLQDQGESITSAVSDDLVVKIEQSKSKTWSIGTNRELKLEAKKATIQATTRREQEQSFRSLTLTPGTTLYFPNGSSLSLQEYEDSTIIEKRMEQGGIQPEYEAFFCHKPPVHCQVRYWRDGDLFHYLGSPGRRKLQDCFTDKKIPMEERHRLPIVLVNNDILWVPGFPPAEKFKIARRGSCVLGLTYRKQLQRLERSAV